MIYSGILNAQGEVLKQMQKSPPPGSMGPMGFILGNLPQGDPNSPQDAGDASSIKDFITNMMQGAKKNMNNIPLDKMTIRELKSELKKCESSENFERAEEINKELKSRDSGSNDKEDKKK